MSRAVCQRYLSLSMHVDEYDRQIFTQFRGTNTLTRHYQKFWHISRPWRKWISLTSTESYIFKEKKVLGIEAIEGR